MPEGENKVLINFATGDPEWFKRRQLLADGLDALSISPKKPSPLKIPPGVDSGIAASLANTFKGDILTFNRFKRAVFATVGLNLYWKLFRADITEELDEHFEYDEIWGPGVLGVPITASKAARMGEIRAKIRAKVFAGPVAPDFMKLAAERGMDGKQRLSEMIWIAMFAGYGGTSTLAFETMRMIIKDPARFVPMYHKDPRAFMIEAARHHPSVGGQNPSAFKEDTNVTLANGHTMHVKAGDPVLVFTSGANFDPTVFENPKEFIPNRLNSDKLMSWNNELGAFAKCPSVAGCPEAPRGCPGTWLSLRIATQAVDYFIQGLENAGLATKREPGQVFWPLREEL